MQNNRKSDLNREFYCRNQSERILDKQLFKRSNLEQLAKMEKQIYGDQQKKVKQEEQVQKVINVNEALEQLIKYLGNNKKQQVALGKLKFIISNHYSQLSVEQILGILKSLSELDIQLNVDVVEELIKEIYKEVEAKFNKDEKEQYKLVQIYGIQLRLRILLKTDDNYVFQDCMKQLKQELKEEENNENNILRQKFILNCFKVLVKQYTNQWAKGQIYTFLMDVNYNFKELFDEQFKQQLVEVIDEIQNKKMSSQTMSTQREIYDAKQMQDYLKPTHDVVDSRSTVNIENGLDQWQLKNCGL